MTSSVGSARARGSTSVQGRPNRSPVVEGQEGSQGAIASDDGAKTYGVSVILERVENINVRTTSADEQRGKKKNEFYPPHAAYAIWRFFVYLKMKAGTTPLWHQDGALLFDDA